MPYLLTAFIRISARCISLSWRRSMMRTFSDTGSDAFLARLSCLFFRRAEKSAICFVSIFANPHILRQAHGDQGYP